jgi:hypothetical protein
MGEHDVHALEIGRATAISHELAQQRLGDAERQD